MAGAGAPANIRIPAIMTIITRIYPVPGPLVAPDEEAMLTALQFGNFVCQVNNHTYSQACGVTDHLIFFLKLLTDCNMQTHVCTNTKTGITTYGYDKQGVFKVESWEPPLLDQWPGISSCLGKDHGDECWEHWDV